MVELKIQKIGDSLGVVLPNEVLRQLNRGEGETVVLVEGPAGQFSIAPSDSNFAKTMAAASDLMRRYDGTLRDLAK
jgi:putative addiction module antidote